MKIAIYKTMLKSTSRVVYVGQTTRIGVIGKYYFGGGKNLKGKYTTPQLKETFDTEIINITENKDEADELERYYIDYYCTLEEYGGFNIAPGGRGKTGTSCRSGEKNSSAKKCVYNGIEFGCIKDAWKYAKDCGYEYGYKAFRKHI